MQRTRLHSKISIPSQHLELFRRQSCLPENGAERSDWDLIVLGDDGRAGSAAIRARELNVTAFLRLDREASGFELALDGFVGCRFKRQFEFGVCRLRVR